MAESHVSPEMEPCVANFSRALKDGVKSMEDLTHKVKEVCASQGLSVDASAVDVIMRALNPFFIPNQAWEGGQTSRVLTGGQASATVSAGQASGLFSTGPGSAAVSGGRASGLFSTGPGSGGLLGGQASGGHHGGQASGGVCARQARGGLLSGQARGCVMGGQAQARVRLGDTPGRWPVKKNKSVTWGEDGELWLMRQLVEWGSNTCDAREKAQMNKDLVAAMQTEFGLTVDGNCVKNKQRDLEDTFQNYEKVRKSLSGLGWQDSQVVWDPEVWEDFKRAHPHKAVDLEGHKRLFTSEKYKLMCTLWGAKNRASGDKLSLLLPGILLFFPCWVPSYCRSLAACLCHSLAACVTPAACLCRS